MARISFIAFLWAFSCRPVALVIGNSNYRLAPLGNPRNDADDVAAALKLPRFDVGCHRPRCGNGRYSMCGEWTSAGQRC